MDFENDTHLPQGGASRYYSGMLLPALLLALLSSLSAQEPGSQRLDMLASDGVELIRTFNNASSSPRILTVLSPTCGHCLEGCSDLQEILSEQPEANVKVFVVWAPYGPDDTAKIARLAMRYLPDSRVQHYWDLWRFGSRSYSEMIRVPEELAWGVLYFYDAGTLWEDKAPEPASWLFHKNLSVGTRYSRTLLSRRIQEVLGLVER